MSEDIKKQISAGLWDLFRSCKAILVDNKGDSNLENLKNKTQKLMDLESQFAEESMNESTRET